MFGVRDLVWSVVVCFALTGMLQCKPEWSARRKAERDARDGFLEAYAGYRFVGGEVITAPGKGAHVDPLRPAVMQRRLEIVAEKLAWGGSKVELIARQQIQLADGTPGGRDASQEIHVRLERRNHRWQYTLFEVRDGPVVADPDTGNPWARALRPDMPAANQGEDG